MNFRALFCCIALAGCGVYSASAAEFLRHHDAPPPYEVRSGQDDRRFASYDRLIGEFMKTHETPGLSVAVTYRGQLAFSRGYGYADLETREQVTPQHLFRIASLSKPITAVAVLQLVEAQKIKLDDRVFDILDDRHQSDDTDENFDPRLKTITIRQLLEHRGGWDREISFDPMFQSVRFARQVGVQPPADQVTIINAMCSQPLDFNPGDRYAYSNFGYCLLGRVIERVSQQSYEEYVKEHVLKPLGITTMKIGRTRAQHRARGEVRYYHPGTVRSVFAEDLGQQVPSPYGGWHLEAMDAHGGWIASVEDLAKFAACFDNPEQCPILSTRSIGLMYERPPREAGYDDNGQPKAVYYSCGWSNRVLKNGKQNHWHTGSLPGTTSILIRRYDGKNFVALINTRASPTTKNLTGVIDRLLHQAANQVTRWPRK